MEVSKLNSSSVQQVNVSYPLTALQRADSPPVDTLTPSVPNEKSCCAQLLEIVTQIIHWIASFFCCSTTENLETTEGIKEYMTRMDACFDQEDGPVVLLRDFVRVFELPLEDEELKATHHYVFNFIMHTMSTDSGPFENSKTSNLYRMILNCFAHNQDNLVLDVLVPAFGRESIDAGLLKDLEAIVYDFNLKHQQKELAEYKNRLSDDLLSFFQSATETLSPTRLIERMIKAFEIELFRFPLFTQFPNAIAVEVDILRTTSSVPETAQTKFYLAIAAELSEEGILDLDLIFEKLDECKITTTDSEREAIKDIAWNHFNNQFQNLLNNFNNDAEIADVLNHPMGLLKMQVELFKKDLPDGFSTYSPGTPNCLALMIHTLKTNPNIKDSRLKQFFLIVGDELVRTGKLNEEEIFRQLDPSEEVRPELERIIREFNQKEGPDNSSP